MDNKLSIKVSVADRFYPLKVDRNDEEMIRRAAKMLNERITQYKQRYNDKDLQDFLAMTSLQFVIKLLETEEKQDINPIIENLKKIDEELGKYIENA